MNKTTNGKVVTGLIAFLMSFSVLRGAGAMAGDPQWPSPVVQLAPAVEPVHAYPNPWRSDRHSGVQITFDRLSPNTTIRIFTVSAEHVKTLSANGPLVRWDLTNDSGSPVASGIYLYLVTNDTGGKASGKLAVIK